MRGGVVKLRCMKAFLLLLFALAVMVCTGGPLRGQEKAAAAADVALPVGKIAYVTSENFGRSGNIFLMAGNVRTMTLAHQTRDLEFVDGGRSILYSANDPEAKGIHLYDLTLHTNTRLLPRNDEADSPALSPDGKRIAFVQGGESGSQIMTAALDGTDLKQVTDGPGFNWTPRWSPDGRRLLFETTRNEPPGGGEAGGHRDLYVMDADGSHLTNLTEGSYGHNASWSPDGKFIAYMKYGDIFTMKSDGSEKKNISKAKTRDSEPAWSPDGQWIAFTRTPEGRNAMDIWIMKSDGTQQRPITFNTGTTTSYSPSWGKE